MRGNELLDKMYLVNPIYIEAADAMPKPASKKWQRFTALAASVALILCAGVMHLIFQQQNPAPDLPLLTISEIVSEGMGFEDYRVYDINELKNSNPWSENAEISTLPVYKNPLPQDTKQSISIADITKMKECLSETANRLGVKISASEISFSPSDSTVAAATETFKIQVDTAMTATISFTPAIALPEKYNFSNHATYEESLKTAQYLKNAYKEILHMENAQDNIYGGDYTITFQQNYQIEFFDATGNDIEKIINYNFNGVAFYGDDNGNLFLIRIFQPDLSQKTGDYPIITTAEAMELLLNGNYITSVPYEMTGENSIARVELIYRTGAYEPYYMPYYRFYVEIPELEENGLKTYGAYYVPAVEASYISNMPL